MSSLSLNLLGKTGAYLDGEVLADLRSSKVLALLIYLAVERSIAHRREVLYTLLWPRMPEKSARHNLRQTLYGLRQAFPEVLGLEKDKSVPLLLSDRQTVQLNPEALVEVDIHQTDHLLEGIQIHDHINLDSCQSCIQALEQIVALYRGDFLADFYLEDSNPFEDWAQTNRDAYRRKAMESLARLTEIYLRKNDFEQARVYANMQLKIDPLRESAYRQLMELHSKAGQRTEALRTYQSCVQTLETQLGVQPSNETISLYQIIRGEDTKQTATTQQPENIRGYKIREYLGSGHTAMVYRAYQPVISRDVAIKVILPQFANHPNFIRHFEVEAQLVARLEHPYIVPLYDFWRDPTGAYLVMRWFKGGNLADDLARGPWKPNKAVGLVEQISAALDLAHRQGVVHCDIKPSNIMLDEEGNAYLSDFGIAKLTGPFRQLSRDSDDGGVDSSSSSLGYISPEVSRGLETTQLADVYSFGVVLYELLTGEHPFPGLSAEMLVEKHLNQPLPSVCARNPELPDSVDAVIQRATSKDPAERYPNAPALAQDLRKSLLQDITVTPLPESDRFFKIRNPYKGLQAFQEADADDFFGRKNLIQRILARLALADGKSGIARFLAVVGPSGSGKSSVVHAGLLPNLRQGALPGSENWFIVEMSFGTDPIENLANALLQIATGHPEDLPYMLQTDHRGLINATRAVLPGADSQILLLIDQFETLFTLVDQEPLREHIMDLLATAATDPLSSVRVLVTLRADFYDRPLHHGAFGELIRAASEVVLPLTTVELTQAMSSPAERVGVDLEAGLVNALVTDIAEQPGALPLLQYTLTKLFENRSNNQLTLQAYQAIGGVLGALTQQADAIYQDLSESEQWVSQQLFLRLVTLSEGVEYTRRRVLLTELASLGKLDDKLKHSQDSYPDTSILDTLLDLYGRHRLLTFDHDPITREPTVEVAHEAILQEWPRLRDWLDESRDDIRLQRLLGTAVSEWQESGKDNSFLLRGSRLDQFSAWRASARVALTEAEKAYLNASLEARELRQVAEAKRRERERVLEKRSRIVLRALVGVFAVATLIAGLLTIFAFNQRDLFWEESRSRATQQVIAEDQARIAFARELAAASNNNTVLNPELSLLLALQAINIIREADGTVINEAESALHQAVQASHNQFVLPGDVYEGDAVFSPDGTYIASIAGGEVHLIDFLTGETQLVIPIGKYSGNLTTVVFSPDGGRLVALLNDGFVGELKIWDLETGDVVLSKEGDFAVVNPPPLSYSPDGNKIAAVNPNGDAIIVGISSGETLMTLVHEFWVNNLTFSPDGNLLATVDSDGAFNIWDLETQTLQLSLQGHHLPAHGVQFSPDGKLLVTTGRDRRVIVWDLETGEQKLLLHGMIGGDPLHVTSFSPDGKRLASADSNAQIQMWDLEWGLELYRFTCVSAPFGLHFSPDFSHVVSMGTSGPPAVCRVGPDLEAYALAGHAPGIEVWGADFDASGKLFVTGAWDAVNVWDLTEQIPPGSVVDQPTISLPSKDALDLSPDGTRIASDNYEGNGIIWDSETGEKVLDLIIPGGVTCFNFSPDSSRLLAGTFNGTVLLFDPNTGKVQLEISAHDEFVSAARFSPDSKRIVTVGWGSESVRVWDAESGDLLQEFPIVSTKWDAGFSPDGTRVAVGTWEGNLMIWDVETGELITEYPGESNPIFRLDYSTDGKRVFTGTYDGKVSVWDSYTGQKLYTMADLLGGAWYVATSPDGKFLAATNQDGLTRFFNLDLDDLISLAQTRITRSFTNEECKQYLHMDECP